MTLATIVEEPAPLDENFEDENESGDDQGSAEEQRAAEREGAGSMDESEAGRRRRRRRRRRGGERTFGESIAPDAPQPTDDGLAVVAEIGGDLQAPVGEAEAFIRRDPRGEADRGRRSRRSRGGRNRFSSRPSEGAFGEPQPLGDEELVEREPAAADSGCDPGVGS